MKVEKVKARCKIKMFLKIKLKHISGLNGVTLLCCFIMLLDPTGAAGYKNRSESAIREILHRGHSSNISRAKESEIIGVITPTDRYEYETINCTKSCLHEEFENLHDEHVIQGILRDVFVGTKNCAKSIHANIILQNAGPLDEDSEENETFVDSDEIVPSNSLSRRGRSLDNETGLLSPAGKGVRTGKARTKKTRASPSGEKNKKGKGKVSGSSGRNKQKSKSSDLKKYNEYMDAVLTRMNVMIKKKRMDPLRVNLYAGPNNNKAGGTSSSDKKKPNKGKKKEGKTHNSKHSPRMDLVEEGDEEEDSVEDENGPARKDVYLNVPTADHSSGHDGELELDEEEDEENVRKMRALLENAGSSNSSSSSASSDPDESEGPRGNESSPKPKKPNGKPNKKKNNKPTTTSSSSDGESSKVKDKNNNKNKTQKANNRPTRGILHGLSSLKRNGNVAVIRQGDNVRVIRSNFLLGPVSLEILPKKGKADEKQPAATATASELKGVLEVRIKKGSPTKIRKLRVYPPKSVKVAGSSGSKGKPQQYGKVTPLATARLRQIASTVVRETDKKLKVPKI